MNRELVLAGAALAVIVAALLVGALAPGAIAEPEPPDADRERSGRVAVEEVTLAAGSVTGGTATLSVDTYLRHYGGPVENVTVVLRATDADTGLVEATRELEVGTLDGDAERRVNGSLTVPRESSYRIETVVYRNGSRVGSTSQRVSGVASLTPAYADTAVEFYRFESAYSFGSGSDLQTVPAVEYRIDSTTDDRVTLAVSTYLTNTGDVSESDLRLEVKARQSGSNVVADSTTVDLDAIEPGVTATPTADLTVPEGYDYYLDAVLWKDDTIVSTAHAPANLGPGNLTAAGTTREDGLEVSDFDRTDERPSTEDTADGDRTTAGSGQPGFGVAAAAVALLALAASLRARTTKRGETTEDDR